MLDERTGEAVLKNAPANTLWSETFTIRSYQVGPGGFATPQSLCRFLQEAASNHAEVLRIGGEELAEQDLMWVLSRLRLRMKKIPLWRQEITVETWPSQRTSGIRAHRDFKIYDDAGTAVGEAGSVWLLLSKKNRRPVRVPEFLDEYRLPGLPEDLLLDSEVALLEESHLQKEFEVCATHLDFNNHVNNVCYLEWALNTLPPEVFERFQVSEILFNFLAEGKLGDLVRARSEKQLSSPDFTFRHTIENVAEARKLAAIKTIWQPR